MFARNLVTAFGALAATVALTAGSAHADAGLTVDSAVESNGNAVIGISYQCAPGLGAELSVTVRETPFLGSGINGTTLAPATCVGLPQSTSVTVNPVQLLGDSAKFQSGSITDVTVTVLNLTISSPAATTKKRFAHLG